MAKYVFTYSGGTAQASEAEREAAMAAWGAWLGGMGPRALDIGNPFGPSAAVGPGGVVADGSPSGLTGYSIIGADDLAAATELAKGCPVLEVGGSVHVHEVFELM